MDMHSTRNVYGSCEVATDVEFECATSMLVNIVNGTLDRICIEGGAIVFYAEE